MGEARRKKWALTALAIVGILALGGLGISSWLLSRWTGIRTATAGEARAILDTAVLTAGPESPYIEIREAGRVEVHRDLEGTEEIALSTLHVLAFDPHRHQLYSMDFPWWFVRAKMSSSLNLGTLVTGLAGDWENLNLKVTEDDLERRGPGLVLDHATETDGRVVVWTD